MFISFKHVPTTLPDYIEEKKVGPQKIFSFDENFDGGLLLADQSNLYTMWIMLRKINLPIQIPSWTWFNIKLCKSSQISQSNIGYLDCLDDPATEMSTIYHIPE